MEPAKVTPKDFFLWLGVIVAVYGGTISLITLLFEYINTLFPDPLAYYGDPYSSAVRFSMASVIVLVPLGIFLAYLIRKSIVAEPGKAQIWVRRWALVLTLFIAAATITIDLITLINTFLGGEITTRFLLKVVVVLLVAGGIFLHFLADLKGYWLSNMKKATLVAVSVLVLALLVVGSGFIIIGSPTDQRLYRFDEEKQSDLQNIQYQILNFYQQKERLPETLEEVQDPLSSYMLPLDPQTNAPYRYERTGALSFTLCATFNKESRDMTGRGGYPERDVAYPSMGMGVDETWKHGEGETCFTRTIDPERYPAYPKPL